VKDRIIFPDDWKMRWRPFYDQITTFKKMGKNKHDDAADTVTQIVEYMCGDQDATPVFIKRRRR
jgi:predicted phage terminase large subunit-like protein